MDGDFIQITDAIGGKWAIALDTDGSGVANTGPIYVASTPIVVDISGAVLAPSVALAVFNALTAPFLAKFTVTNNLNGTLTIAAKTYAVCSAVELKDAAETGAGSITNTHSITGAVQTAEPTGALWVAATAARRAMCDISACTTATDVANAFETTLAGLTGISLLMTVGSSSVADIPITHIVRGVIATPTPKNAVDTGVGTITAANTVTGINSAINVTTNVVTKTAHGLVTGQSVAATTTGTLPDPLTTTDYFVTRLTVDTFSLATTRGLALAGTAVNLTDQGSNGNTSTFTANANAGSLLIEYCPDVDLPTSESTWYTYATLNLASASNPTLTAVVDNAHMWVRTNLSQTAGTLATRKTTVFGKAF